MTSLTDMPADIVEAARVLNMKLHNATELGQRTQWIAEALFAASQRGIVLTAWEREELLRYSECGEGFPNYGEKERSRWKALVGKLTAPKGGA